jgi:NAD(P) transhydrogenase subunit alpha
MKTGCSHRRSRCRVRRKLCTHGGRKNHHHHGVTIIGERNLPGLLPQNASEMYSRNTTALLTYLATKDGFKWEMDEEITKGCLITHQGQVVHEATKNILNL